MKKLALIYALLLVASPAAAQLATSSEVQQFGGPAVQSTATVAPPTGVFCIEEMTATLSRLGFDGVAPEATGRPSYHPSVLLKLYICGYLNRVQSSRRLEREAGRNLEVMWLTGRLIPDHKIVLLPPVLFIASTICNCPE